MSTNASRVGAGQQLRHRRGQPGQHSGVDGVELSDVPERECPQERAQRRRGPHPGEDLGHPAVAQHVEVVDAVRADQHPCDHRGRFHASVRRGHAQMLLQQVLQAGLLRQPHHWHQSGRTNQVRVIENGGYLVRCLHLSDAPSDGTDQALDKSNPPASQGHSHVTTHPTRPPIGGSGLSVAGRCPAGPGHKVRTMALVVTFDLPSYYYLVARSRPRGTSGHSDLLVFDLSTSSTGVVRPSVGELADGPAGLRSDTKSASAPATNTTRPHASQPAWKPYA